MITSRIHCRLMTFYCIYVWFWVRKKSENCSNSFMTGMVWLKGFRCLLLTSYMSIISKNIFFIFLELENRSRCVSVNTSNNKSSDKFGYIKGRYLVGESFFTFLLTRRCIAASSLPQISSSYGKPLAKASDYF